MLALLTNMVPFFEISFDHFACLTHFMKNYAIAEIYNKKKIICDTGLINMRI